MRVKQKPSEKIHRRYLLISESSRGAIEKAILEFIGVLGWARSAPLWVNTKSKDLVLAIRRESLNSVRAAFEAAGFSGKVKKVSGTLKGLGIK